MTILIEDSPVSLAGALEASGAPVHTTLGVRRILDPGLDPDANAAEVDPAPAVERGRGCDPGRDPVRRVCQRKADWRRS